MLLPFHFAISHNSSLAHCSRILTRARHGQSPTSKEPSGHHNHGSWILLEMSIWPRSADGRTRMRSKLTQSRISQARKQGSVSTSKVWGSMGGLTQKMIPVLIRQRSLLLHLWSGSLHEHAKIDKIAQRIKTGESVRKKKSAKPDTEAKDLWGMCDHMACVRH